MPSSPSRAIINLVFFALGSMILAGCQSAVPSNQTSPTPDLNPKILQNTLILPPASDASLRPYAFSAGDVIEVKFFYTPELNEIQDVRPDGKISLQIIGEVLIVDKTPAELRELLKQRYAEHLKDPEIAVIARSFSKQRIFVGGQVMRPGTIEMKGSMTALEAIMEAGGIDFKEAQVRNVVVVRHRDGTRYGYLLNMDPALKGQETQPFFLEPKDIVYVPRTQIAQVNQWIDQHINKIIPQTGFVFSHRRGDTSVGIDTSGR